jgi:hypothetical protein
VREKIAAVSQARRIGVCLGQSGDCHLCESGSAWDTAWLIAWRLIPAPVP